ncbi:MAG TPA: nucleotidyltransferase family protein [Candidatus Omnitrophota bacterium]|nr:nucleotidyltransferase family protein [Candidatus Omnitrophota bacterium]
MKVLILAAGYGTRLYSLVKDTAKTLLDINGKPIIDHIVEHLRDLPDIKEILVITNDKFYQQIKRWSQGYSSQDVKVTVINDGTKSNEDRLGSIGDINFVLKNMKVADDLLVIGGDNLFNFNLDQFARFAQSRPKDVTIGVFDIKDKSQANKFGVVELGKDGKVASFEEKPAKPKSSLIAMCFYYLPKKTLGLIADYLVQSGKSDRAGDYVIWLKSTHDVYGFQFSGKWYDIGSIESYHEAQQAFS